MEQNQHLANELKRADDMYSSAYLTVQYIRLLEIHKAEMWRIQQAHKELSDQIKGSIIMLGGLIRGVALSDAEIKKMFSSVKNYQQLIPLVEGYVVKVADYINNRHKEHKAKLEQIEWHQYWKTIAFNLTVFVNSLGLLGTFVLKQPETK